MPFLLSDDSRYATGTVHAVDGDLTTANSSIVGAEVHPDARSDVAGLPPEGEPFEDLLRLHDDQPRQAS